MGQEIQDQGRGCIRVVLTPKILGPGQDLKLREDEEVLKCVGPDRRYSSFD